jgi:2-polyprenyl-6-methoxyphenol hydroxylase-like FAD-dependent oxidoreductase
MGSIGKVLVVGGGIAGMCLAIGLRQRGIAVDIVEISGEWTALGVGISLGGPAMRALKTIGVLDRCVEAGFGVTRLARGNARGEIVAIDGEASRLNGPEYPATLGIMRPVFHRILADATREVAARVRLGVTVEAIQQRPESVEARLSDGTSGQYDLNVGADGINSRVRELVFGSELKPRFTGQAIWRATVPRPPEVDVLISFMGPRNKAGFNPVSKDLMYIFLVTNHQDKTEIPRAGLVEAMREQLADFGGLVARAREQVVTPEQVVCRPAEALLVPPPRCRGRVVLIGDAAHATTPHLASGALIAIEDAVVLAELAATDVPVPELLERFMTRRYERCRMVVEHSLQLGEWEQHPDAPGADPLGLQQRTRAALAQPI